MATANATIKAVLDYLNQKSSSSVPTGAICYFATKAIPTGWLLCNGSNVSRTTYAALFAAIGTKFGTGNGSSTFTLPNLDERFIEGTTTTSDVGKKLEAGLPNIMGELGPALAQNSGTINNLVSGAISIDRSHDGKDLIGGSHWSAKGLAFSASQSNSVYGISSDVQPRSILLSPCIKF